MEGVDRGQPGLGSRPNRCAAARAPGATPAAVSLVAVSKTQPAAAVRAALAAGQRVFGENRVQEALEKFPALRGEFPDLRLHLIGPLQTNKVRDAVAHFDVIETVDRLRLAEALAREMERTGRRLPLLYRGQYRRGAAKGRDASGDGRRLHRRLPRPARPADRRADVHPAARRGAVAAFRAAARDRRAATGLPGSAWG